MRLEAQKIFKSKFLRSNFDFFILFIIGILVILSRIFFINRYLYDWDSVNYALAFENYNIALQQPHPPGYILFVATGKIINYFFNDPNSSMIFLGVILSILTVVIIYFLSKQMFSIEVAVIASLLLAFNPVFWFYGEVASIYMNEAFFATLIAYTSYQLFRGDNRFLYISSIVLGLSGGFRQDLIMFMFPLWFFCLIYKNKDYKRVLKALFLLAISVLIWFIPTIVLAGGYEKYMFINRSQLFSSFGTTSLFFGSTVMNALINYFKLIACSIWGFGIISCIILIIFIYFHFKSIFKLSFLKNTKLIFLSLWILPSFMFYLLIFMGKPGYILVYLPAFAIITAYVLINFSSDRNNRFKNISKKHFLIMALCLCLLSGAVQFIYPSSIGMDYGTIYNNDTNYHHLNQAITGFNPNNTIIFTDDPIIWRKNIYYHPDYESYCYYSYAGTLAGLHYKNHTFETNPGSKIYFNSSTKVVWIINENSNIFKTLKGINLTLIELPNRQKIYYSDIENSREVEIKL